MEEHNRLDYEGGQEQLSDYNSALDQLKRIGELWRKANIVSTRGQFKLWDIVLDRILCELSGDFKEQEWEEIENDMQKFEKDIGNIIDAKKGFEEPDSDFIKNRNKQYKILMIKERYLRRLIEKKGKGSKWQDDTMEYMEQ